MSEFRLVGYATGLLTLALSAVMLLPAVVDLFAGNPDWRSFVASAILSAFIGGALTLGCFGADVDSRVGIRQAFLIVVVSWALLPVFGALPFVFGVYKVPFVDALFESVSGMTTTGATSFSGLGYLTPGVLLWRALLQWIGGLGIILFALVFLPTMRIGGMQLFRSESLDSDGSLLVRFRDIGPTILAVYFGLTLLCALFYRAFGMPGFDAVCNAMTTMATGGFATLDSSFADYETGAQLTCVVFMLIASLPFLRYVEFVNIRIFRLHKDPQVRGFFMVIVAVWLTMTAFRVHGARVGAEDAASEAGDVGPIAPDESIGEIAMDVLFNITSIITGSGFVSANYGEWGQPYIVVFFLLMFIGGCAGSTTCSVKIFRYQVLGLLALGELKRLRRPNRIVILRYGGQPLSPEVTASVVTFFFLFLISLMVFTIALSFTGLDMISSVTGAATALANVGPGLGDTIGPVASYAEIGSDAKIILIIAMLVGRLELISVFILFTPGFWRK